jgi:hypothetical protein
MNEVHKKALAEMCVLYGHYKVAKALAENAENVCRTDYANNDEAVVHRDAATLANAVQDMKANHPLRSFD